MIYNLGRIMGHIGHAAPEAEPWAILKTLGIDVELAKKAVQKLYLEPVTVVDKFGRSVPSYETYHDVFFIPNKTKHGTAFAMKYGTKINE